MKILKVIPGEVAAQRSLLGRYFGWLLIWMTDRVLVTLITSLGIHIEWSTGEEAQLIVVRGFKLLGHETASLDGL